MNVNIQSKFQTLQACPNPKKLYHVYNSEVCTSQLVYADQPTQAGLYALNHDKAKYIKPVSEWTEIEKLEFLEQSFDITELGYVI